MITHTWQKSSYSNQAGGNCVEVRMSVDTAIDVRDSTTPGRGHLTFSTAAWQAFLAAAREEEL